MSEDRAITEILTRTGYGHRPIGGNGKHEIFSFNTMEVVAIADAHDALAAVGFSLPRAPYVQSYDRLYLCVLNQSAHDRTCGYWYTVTSRASAHTAFATRAGLLRYLEERGLSVDADIPAPGEYAGFHIVGAYRTALHMSRAAFDALEGVRTRAMSNGEYTLAIVTVDPDGLRTVHTLNPNVRDRPVFDYRESRALFS